MKKPSSGRSAIFVASGILLSRISGLVRQRVFAHYFGLSDPAAAFTAASRIANFLQNLFGEGAMSASFIPVYASLVARGDQREADRVAGAVASLLALLVAVLVLAGVLATPIFVEAIAPGFTGALRELTIEIVRVLFPAVGLLVMSAWCLGVLNSHHRFLLSYTTPVIWNAAMIATLVIFGRSPLSRLAVLLAWGSVAGSALMVIFQLPIVVRVAPHLKFALDTASKHVRTVLSNFFPVFISRGVVQLSAYIDSFLASYLPAAAVAGLGNAQLLYLLPIGLFGMSVSAAELPAMSGELGTDPAATEAVRRRLGLGLRQIAFFVVPSAVAFLALGDVVTAAVFESTGGRFTHADAVYVWGILAGSGVGLLASTLGRLYSSTYYALRDTRTPLRFAIARVILTTVLGYLFAIPLPIWLGIPRMWGAAGLTASAGIAGWIEMLLLRRKLQARIGDAGPDAGYLVRLWAAALGGAAVAWAVKLALPAMHPALAAALILGPYGIVYFAATLALRIPEASSSFGRFRRIVAR